MRINVPVNTISVEDPRGKHLPTFRGLQRISTRASQVGNGININFGDYEISLDPKDGTELIRIIRKALEDNVEIEHTGEVIW